MASGDGAAGARAGQAGPGQEPQQAAALSYEQARDQLTEVVRRLEAGGLTLEQSLDLWERGERLAALCEEWLEGARARLAAVTSAKAPDPGADHAEAPF